MWRRRLLGSEAVGQNFLQQLQTDACSHASRHVNQNAAAAFSDLAHHDAIFTPFLGLAATWFWSRRSPPAAYGTSRSFLVGRWSCPAAPNLDLPQARYTPGSSEPYSFWLARLKKPIWKHCTPSASLSCLYTLHFTLYIAHSTLCSPRTTIYTLHFTLRTLHLTLDTLHVSIYAPHFTPYAVHSTIYNLHCALHTLHFTLPALHFALYTFHSTLYILH